MIYRIKCESDPFLVFTPAFCRNQDDAIIAIREAFGCDVEFHLVNKSPNTYAFWYGAHRFTLTFEPGEHSGFINNRVNGEAERN